MHRLTRMQRQLKRAIPPTVALLGLLLPISAGGQGVLPALSYLSASQSSTGAWGTPDGTALRDTTVVVDTLAALAQTGVAYQRGIASLQNSFAANSDHLSRQLVSLAGAGTDISALNLLAAQAADTVDTTAPNYPRGGWGVALGFATDTLDTALALRALQAAGLERGLTVVNEQVPVGATTASHPFNFPAGATGLSIFIRSTTGSVRLSTTTPTSGTFSIDRTPANVPINLVGLPEEAGTYSVKAQNLDTVPIAYALEVRFTTADGFTVEHISRALRYLALVQNPDGGWGIANGEASSLMITAEVLLTLEAYSSAFVPQSVIDQGLNWLQSRQNANGGFGSDPGVSTVYETGLALLALESGGRIASATIDPARTYLLATQGANGSWNDDPYSTALALRGVAQALVAGSVDEQGRSAKPNAQWSIPLQVKVTPAGQPSPVTQFTTTTDENGMFTVTGIVPGTYDVRVKGDHTLQNKRTVALAFGSNTLDAGTLREGDANNDNVVSLTDFSILVTTFGKCQGTGGFDPRADFNQSGCVTIQDFSLMVPNFGQAGDP